MTQQGSSPNNGLRATSFGAGLVSALLFLAAGAGTGFGGLLQLLAPLPLYHTALSGGLWAALAATMTGFALIAAMIPALESLLIYLGLMCIPVIAFAWVLDRRADVTSGEGLGFLLAAIAGSIGIVALAGMFYLDSHLSATGGVLGLSKSVAREGFAAMAQMGFADANVAEREKIIEIIGRQLPAGLATMAVAVHLFNAIAAASLRARRHDLPRPQYSDFSLARPFVLTTALLMPVSLLGGPFGLYMGVLAGALMLTLTVQGLAVTHVVSKTWPLRPLALGLIYSFTVLVGGSRFVLAVIGVLDHWLNFRKKATPPRGDQEPPRG